MHPPAVKIEWYYDFISPYAYLASQALDRFSKTVEIVPKPVLFAGLLKQWQTRGPAEIVPMRRFTYRQIAWLAHKHAIPLRFPPVHPFNPLSLLRLDLALGSELGTIDRLFKFVWAEGKRSDDPGDWASLAASLDLSPSEADERINDPRIKRLLVENTETAIARGVFGVPTFIVNGELFWGFDSIPFVNDYLDDPNLLSEPTIQQADSVGEGVERRR